MPEGPARVRASGSTREAVREFFAAEVRNNERIRKFELGLTDDQELPAYVPEDHPYPKAMYPLGYPQEEPIVVEDANEEREKVNEGYYPSLAEAKAAREELEADVGQPEEEETATPVPTPKPPPPKRSHKKKPVAAA